MDCILSMMVSTPSSSSGRYDFTTVLQRSRFNTRCIQGKEEATHLKCAPISNSVMVFGKAGESAEEAHLGSRKYFVTASVSSKWIS